MVPGWCWQTLHPAARALAVRVHAMTPWGEDDVDRTPAPASAPSPGGLASPTPSALVSSRPTPSARPHVRRRAIRTAVDLRTLRLCKYFLPHWHDDGASTRSALFGRQSVAYGIRHLPFHAVPWRSVALRVLHCEVRGVCWCVAADTAFGPRPTATGATESNAVRVQRCTRRVVRHRDARGQCCGTAWIRARRRTWA